MSTSNPSNQTVLLVDDEFLVRMVAAEILEDAGLTVYEAASADEAMTQINANPDIGLLFSDVNMPGSMDGIELASEVARRWPKVKILVTSGRARIPETDLPDMGSFLPKPYSATDLVRAVREKLATSKS